MASQRSVVQLGARTSLLMGVDFVPLPARPASSTPAVADTMAAPGLTPSAGSPAHRPAAAPAAAWATLPPLVGPRAAKSREAAHGELEAIRTRYLADAPHNQFNTTFTNIVFGEGDPRARLMFIGEAPGADEDRTGRPFVGKAGQLLEKMMAAMGLRREEVYIANVLKTRPPDNATPTSFEIDLCKMYLFDQVAAVMPEVIVTLGLPASRTVLSAEPGASMASMRGRWAEFRHPDELRFAHVRVPVMPTFHPAYLLRAYTEENRAKVWSDLRMVMERLGMLGGQPGGA
ncbi:MAG: uracil-DNA glycosylase [Planctomycetaceae bacterium]|jgi:uracil-DNA glycosylase family 4|nr:uracil-DNA glycosylase [Planctomycetaceae bacterium]